MFLKEYLVDHPDAGTEAIDSAWREAAHSIRDDAERERARETRESFKREPPAQSSP